MIDKNQNILQKLWEKYNQLCKDLGVENGACRGCVPVVKFDPETKKTDIDTAQQNTGD